jgi:TonB family protein
MSNHIQARVRAGAAACALVALAVSLAACSGPGAADGESGGTMSRSVSGKASRSPEEVHLAVGRIKGGLYAIYTQALHADASLQGKVVVEFTIAANGSVTECHFVSSELKSADLEQKLLARFRSLQFSAEDVDTLVTKYSIDFLPS